MTDYPTPKLNFGDDSLERDFLFYRLARRNQRFFLSSIGEIHRLPLHAEFAVSDRCVAMNHHDLLNCTNLTNSPNSAPLHVLVVTHICLDTVNGVSNVAAFAEAGQFAFARPLRLPCFDYTFGFCIGRVPLLDHHARGPRHQLFFWIFLEGHNWPGLTGIRSVRRHQQQVLQVNIRKLANGTPLRAAFGPEVNPIAFLGDDPHGFGQLLPPWSSPPRSESRVTVNDEVSDLQHFHLAEAIGSLGSLS